MDSQAFTGDLGMIASLSSDQEATPSQNRGPSDDAFTKFLGGLERKLDTSLGNLAKRLLNLDHQCAELHRKIQPVSQAVQPQANNSSAVTPANYGTLARTVTNMEVSMTIPKGLNASPSSVTASKTRNELHRNVDLICFRPLENRLTKKDQFEYWKQSVVEQIESQCGFVLDPREVQPTSFTNDEISLAQRKVRCFIFESLGMYFTDLVQDLTDPKNIMDKLQELCDPSSTVQLKRLLSEFNSIQFNSKCEKAIEFFVRFDEVRKKIASINPTMLNPEYIKIIFESAIHDTDTYQKAQLEGFKFSVSELCYMLLEEQLRAEQSASSGQAGLSRVTPERIKVVSKVGKSGSIRQKTKIGKQDTTRLKKTFCVYCKRKGHTKDTCLKSLRLCYKCAGHGHNIANCPQPSM